MTSPSSESNNLPQPIKVIKTRIANQSYLDWEETVQFSKFGDFIKSYYHQVGRLMNKFTGHNTDHNPFSSLKLADSLKSPILKKLFSKHSLNMDLICAKHNLYIQPSAEGGMRSIHFRNVVGAFVFYSIAQGDFIENIKSATLTSLKKEPLIKVPNPFLKHELRDLSVIDANIVVCVMFGLMSYVMSIPCTGKTKRVTSRSQFYIEPTIKTNYGRKSTNSAKVKSKNKDYSLTYKSVDRLEYKKHCALFTVVHGYDGYDVDDWLYFRFYEGAVNSGYCEDKYALSPSLGIKRKFSIGEYYNLS